jgi:exodeoxyribonuclease V alpha subunit
MPEFPMLTALDRHFADFIVRLDKSPCDELWLAAALTSTVTGAGHVCLHLAAAAANEMEAFRGDYLLRPPSVEKWRDTLASCSTVGRPGDYTPLVLDNAGRLYLHRSWDHESRVAAGIVARCRFVPFDQERLRSGLDHYFPVSSEEPDLQRVAAAATVTRLFTVITGGPGTGKTTTVVRILALLIEQSDEKDISIALAAPTGKAAMRLRHAIIQAAGRLELSERVRMLMPEKVQTIHRLLGAIPGSISFRQNRENKLTCDILVVDEASMVDLPLVSRLLEALPESCRVILLGDQDQLASVEAGAVLADICNSGAKNRFSDGFAAMLENFCGKLNSVSDSSTDSSPISDSIIKLQTSYRFGSGSGIGMLSRLIKNGDGDAALSLLASGEYNDIIWRQLPQQSDFALHFTEAATHGYSGYTAATSPLAALEALDSFRILSPLRSGIYGVDNLNRLAEAALGLRRPDGEQWCRLLPLMVTGNDYELGLFNGDTAVLYNDCETGRMAAFFQESEGGVRRISPLRLPTNETALALTVHKCQGSEFDKVLLILPERMSDLLTRELLYTAITRGRSRVEIWGNEEVFLRAVERRIERRSGLRERLWGNFSGGVP